MNEQLNSDFLKPDKESLKETTVEGINSNKYTDINTELTESAINSNNKTESNTELINPEKKNSIIRSETIITAIRPEVDSIIEPGIKSESSVVDIIINNNIDNNNNNNNNNNNINNNHKQNVVQSPPSRPLYVPITKIIKPKTIASAISIDSSNPPHNNNVKRVVSFDDQPSIIGDNTPPSIEPSINNTPPISSPDRPKSSLITDPIQVTPNLQSNISSDQNQPLPIESNSSPQSTLALKFQFLNEIAAKNSSSKTVPITQPVSILRPIEIQPDTPRPIVNQPDTPQPIVYQPDTSRPIVNQADTSQPIVETRPNISQSIETQPIKTPPPRPSTNPRLLPRSSDLLSDSVHNPTDFTNNDNNNNKSSLSPPKINSSTPKKFNFFKSDKNQFGTGCNFAGERTPLSITDPRSPLPKFSDSTYLPAYSPEASASAVPADVSYVPSDSSQQPILLPTRKISGNKNTKSLSTFSKPFSVLLGQGKSKTANEKNQRKNNYNNSPIYFPTTATESSPLESREKAQKSSTLERGFSSTSSKSSQLLSALTEARFSRPNLDIRSFCRRIADSFRETMAKLREDIRQLAFWRSILAEFLGSLFLILFGCGSWTHNSSLENQPDAVKIALTFGLTFTALIICFRSITEGHHINSSLTIALLATRRTSVIRALLYLLSQLLGAILGAAFLFAVTSHDLRVKTNHSIGCTVPGAGVNEGQAFGVEFFATFFFVFVAFACSEKRTAGLGGGSKTTKFRKYAGLLRIDGGSSRGNSKAADVMIGGTQAVNRDELEYLRKGDPENNRDNGVEFFATKTSSAAAIGGGNATNNYLVGGTDNDEEDDDENGDLSFYDSKTAPFVIGLTYAAATLFAVPYSGASLSPTRSFGPALIAGVYTKHWVYWFGPILGGILGGVVYDLIFSAKSSVERLRSCLLVFHRRQPNPGTAATGSGAAQPALTPSWDNANNERQDYKSPTSRFKFQTPKLPSWLHKKDSISSPSPAGV